MDLLPQYGQYFGFFLADIPINWNLILQALHKKVAAVMVECYALPSR
jgi:hypothetical protein